MGKYDSQVLHQAQQLQHEQNLPHLVDILKHPQIVEANRKNGLVHNYVDENGKPDTSIGVGVVNGLPELEAYMQTGTLLTENLDSIILTSDGGLLPQSLEGNNSMIESIFEIIETKGVPAYIDHIRQLERADNKLDQYPRFKIHDDATVLYAKWNT
jgi:hypothetical protein